MNLRKRAALVLVFAGAILATTIPAWAENPATGTLTSGDTIEIVIDTPGDGDQVPPAGDPLEITGRTNIPEVPTNPAANVLYVVDVSGSTGFPTGQDCNGDGAVDAGDDLNGDGRVGDTLDCEIRGIIALNESLGDAPIFDGGVVPFGSSAAIADVDGVTDGLSSTFTTPLTNDVSGNGVPDIDDVATSLIVGGARLFEPRSVGGGTNFNAALATLVGGFSGQPAGEANVAYFLSDGQAGVSTGGGSSLQSAIDAGIIVNTYSVGTGASGCGAFAALAVIADQTGGTCTEVDDPSTLAAALTNTPPLGIDRVEVALNGSAPAVANIDAFGNWNITFDAADVPAPPVLVEATVVATDATVVTADILLTSGEVCTDTDRRIEVGFPRPTTERAFRCRLVTEHFDINFNVQGGNATIDGDKVKRAQPVDTADEHTWNATGETIVPGPNDVPDYVDKVAHSLEQGWDTYISKLGFDPPADTGEGRVLVTIWDIADFGFIDAPSGFTIPGLLSLKPNLSRVEYLARHELFHTVQWQYGISPGLTFLGSDEQGLLELTAEWATHRSMQVDPLSSLAADKEDEVYFNDLDLYLNGFSTGTSWGFPLAGPNVAYGKFIFAEYLETHLGTDTIREVWEAVRATGSVNAAMEQVLPITDVSFMSDGTAVSSADLFHDYAVANFYVDDVEQLYDGSFLPFENVYNDVDVSKWRKLSKLKPQKIDVVPIGTSASIAGAPLRLFDAGSSVYYELNTAGWKGSEISFQLNERRNEGIDPVWGKALATLIVCDKPVPVPMNGIEDIPIPSQCRQDLTLVLTNVAIGSDIIVDITILPL